MNEDSMILMCEQNMLALEKMQSWLHRSILTCSDLKLSKPISEEDFDQWENLASRYARCCDFLIGRCLRSIDKYELCDEGTIIDRINRALKRGFGNDLNQWRKFKDLRNQIAHEYEFDLHPELFQEIQICSTELLVVVERVMRYLAEKIIKSSKS